jgi:hypothetical protein
VANTLARQKSPSQTTVGASLSGSCLVLAKETVALVVVSRCSGHGRPATWQRTRSNVCGKPIVRPPLYKDTDTQLCISAAGMIYVRADNGPLPERQGG